MTTEFSVPPPSEMKKHEQQQVAPHDQPDAILQRAEGYKSAIERSYIGLGRELYLIFHRRLYRDWGYDHFDDWLEQGFGMSAERGQRVRRIWTTFIRRLHLRPEQLAGIGYSRALVLLPVVTKENVDDWLEKARTRRWCDFKDDIAESKSPPEEVITAYEEVGAVKRVEPDEETEQEQKSPPKATIVERGRKPLTLRLYDGQMDVWKAARDEVQRSEPGEIAPNECLAHICTVFLAAQSAKEKEPAARASFYMKGMERLFGGKFLWVKDERAVPLLMNLVDEHPDLIEGVPAAERMKEDDLDGYHPDDGSDDEEGKEGAQP